MLGVPAYNKVHVTTESDCPERKTKDLYERLNLTSNNQTPTLSERKRLQPHQRYMVAALAVTRLIISSAMGFSFGFNRGSMSSFTSIQLSIKML